MGIYLCLMEIEFSLDELNTAAEQLTVWLGDCSVLALHGEMGAGKTTLIGALCLRWGVVESTNSPTFSIINAYEAATGKPVFHLDLYRLDTPEEAFAAGVTDVIESGNRCLVEWPERLPALFRTDETLHVRLEVIGENRRRLLRID
jgi:tRNA threonylcarbamoyladenosine biosynthesis protein TsaE